MKTTAIMSAIVVGVLAMTTLAQAERPPALAQDCPELVGRWPYGLAYAVAVSGSHAFFGSGTVLVVADVSNAAAPLAVGEVVLPNVLP